MSSDWQQWQDLPPEREDELIEKLAQAFVKRGLGLMGRMLLESGGPLTNLFAEFYMGIYGPFFDFLEVDEYVALLRNRRNVRRLIERMDELEKERERGGKAKAEDEAEEPG